MLSIAKLRVDAETYYLELVVSGVDEYYSERGEVPGRWIGTAAQGLDLAGHVGGEDLRALLAGRHPTSGETLASPRKVPGFDLTFSAPKSVSILFGLSEHDLSARVVAAHDAAVTAALGYLERQACQVRRGHAGVRQIPGDGFAAAAFRHRTSRAGDPQLHTHVLVANLARGIDGTWSALDARLIYRQLRTAGYLYQAHLRYELTRSLGVAWRPAVRGSADLVGIPNRVLEAFSQRRAEITEAMAQHGTTSRHGAQIAALATRQPKDHDSRPPVLRAEWRQRASLLGFERDDVFALLGRAPRAATLTIDEGAVADALTRESASFDGRAALRAVAELAPAGAAAPHLEEAAKRFLASSSVVRLTDDLYSTRQMLALEADILGSAQRRQNAGLGVASHPALLSLLRDRHDLSDEQANMVAQLTGSGDGVAVVLGVAGSGKTQALQAARAAWQHSGHYVVGAALAARAATELQARSGIPASTLDALLADLDHAGHRLPARAVVVLDEAGMVGTRKLARLLAHADAADAKVVLVGDPHQLPEIEAGGAYAALARQLPAIALTHNQRQHDPVDRQALAELRRGDASAAIRRLRHHGRVTTADTLEGARHQMICDWHTARRAGHDAVMLAVRRSDVDDLNQAARATLAATGELEPDGVSTNGRTFSVGDRVLTVRNRKALGIVNGDRGTIDAISPHCVDVALDRGPNVSLPRSYLEAGHLTHAYALTVHKAQGMTCDQAFILASSGLSHEAGYTALSRGRAENRLYVPSPEPHSVDVGHGIHAAAERATEALVASLETSQRKRLALDDEPLPRSIRAPTLQLARTIGLGR
jgi:conjugative relaxase-like TrwC/TraI family protein